MKNSLLFLLLGIQLAFWNVENFFDYKQCERIGIGKWTAQRFYTKARGIGKTFLYMGGDEPPQIVGLCEVDSRRAVSAIAQSEVLKPWNYRIVHYESPDRRGIDCALLYRDMNLLDSQSIPLIMYGDTVRTRSLLKAEFDSLVVLVVHLPSKRGQKGQKNPAEIRRERLMQMIDSIAFACQKPVIVMGDFNEEASEKSQSLMPHLYEVLAQPFDNQWTNSVSLEQAIHWEHSVVEGSIKFMGRWERIDRVLCSYQFDIRVNEENKNVPFKKQVRTQIVAPSFLLTKDTKHGGLKPLRTFSGPQYLGGLSDHLPLLITIE